MNQEPRIERRLIVNQGLFPWRSDGLELPEFRIFRVFGVFRGLSRAPNFQLPSPIILLLAVLLHLGSLPALGATTNLVNEALASSLSETNLLQPRDRLLFFIEDDPVRTEQPAEIAVNDAGEALFPVSHGFATTLTLKVADRSLTDVRRELKERLDADYYQNVRFTLHLVDRRDASLAVARFFGGVRGIVRLEPGQKKTVADAILELGYDRNANLKKVTISRIDRVSGELQTIKVNVQDVLDGRREADVVLQDGDRVEVAGRVIQFR